MKITLNGEQQEMDADSTVADLLASAGYRDKRVAVEINHRIVSRSAHADYRIQAGDRIEIVHAIGGG